MKKRHRLVRLEEDVGQMFAAYLVISVVFLLLFNLSDAFSFWASLLLKSFMHGVSSFKANFLIAYSIVVDMFVLFFKMNFTTRWRRRFKILCFSSVLFAASVGAVMFVEVIREFQLPLGRYTYHYKNEYVTINYFAHTHATKVVMYHAAKLLGLDSVNQMCDTALPLAPYVHPWLAAALAVSVLLSLTALLLTARVIIESWPRPYRIIVFAAYVFAGAHLLKCLIDGGLLSYDFLPAVLAIHLLFNSTSRRELVEVLRRNGPRYLIGWLVFLAVYAIVGTPGVILQALLSSLFHISIYVFLFTSMWFQRPRRLRTTAILGACFSLMAVYIKIHSCEDMSVLLRKVEVDQKVLSCNYQVPPYRPSNPRLADLSAGSIGLRYIDVYNQTGDSPFRNRNTMIFTDSEPAYYGLFAEFRILRSDKRIKFDSNEFLEFKEVRPVQKGTQAFLVHISFNPDLFPSLWEENPNILTQNNKFAALTYLNRYLLDHGVSEYILIPYFFSKS